MTARIAFYFAAIVALVLFLAAAVPSHATQHRDPILPEVAQKSQPTLATNPPAAKRSSRKARSETRNTPASKKSNASSSGSCRGAK